MSSVHELRKLGYKVKIAHQRRFTLRDPRISRDFFVTTGQIRYDDSKEVELAISEKQRELEDYQEKIALYLKSKPDSPNRIKAINEIFSLDNNDGLTTVSIFYQDSLIATGTSKVNGAVDKVTKKRDVFCRKIGVNQALEKALAQIGLDTLKSNLEEQKTKV